MALTIEIRVVKTTPATERNYAQVSYFFLFFTFYLAVFAALGLSFLKEKRFFFLILGFEWREPGVNVRHFMER